MEKSVQPVFLAFCILMTLLASGCSPASSPVVPASPQTATPPPAEPPQSNVPTEQLITEKRYTIPEAEKLAGFSVMQPAYLPAGVSLDFATFDESPSPAVVLHFKLVHEQYGDMGAFFQIRQQSEAEAPPDTTSCGEMKEGCGVLQINNMPVVYILNTGGTEGLSWYGSGFSYWLLRTAGEPNKIYKDELVKVVESMN